MGTGQSGAATPGLRKVAAWDSARLTGARTSRQSPGSHYATSPVAGEWPGRRPAGSERPSRPRVLYDCYHYFYMLTNTLFYLSSAANPVLYNLVSASFRQVFLSTLACLCPRWGHGRKRPAFSRKANSVSSNHAFSSSVTRETLY